VGKKTRRRGGNIERTRGGGLGSGCGVEESDKRGREGVRGSVGGRGRVGKKRGGERTPVGLGKRGLGGGGVSALDRGGLGG